MTTGNQNPTPEHWDHTAHHPKVMSLWEESRTACCFQLAGTGASTASFLQDIPSCATAPWQSWPSEDLYMCPPAHIQTLSSHVTPRYCTQNTMRHSFRSLCSTWRSHGPAQAAWQAQITATWKLPFFSRKKPASQQRLQHSSSLTAPTTHVPQGLEAAKCQEVEMSARMIVPTGYTCQQAVRADTDSGCKHTHKNCNPVKMASTTLLE